MLLLPKGGGLTSSTYLMARKCLLNLEKQTPSSAIQGPLANVVYRHRYLPEKKKTSKNNKPDTLKTKTGDVS